MKYGNYVYPVGANVIGYCISFSSVAMLPIVAIYKVARLKKGNLRERVQFLLQPTSSWGPAAKVSAGGGAPTHTDSQIPLTSSCTNCKLNYSFSSSMFILMDLLYVSDDLESSLDMVMEQLEVDNDLADEGLHMASH